MMYQTIPTSRLDFLLDSGFSGTVVDLRNEESYQASHIKGAVNIPYDQFFSIWNTRDYNQPLLLYCLRGGQSMMVCNQLSRMGYQVLNLSNGIGNYRGKYLVKE